MTFLQAGNPGPYRARSAGKYFTDRGAPLSETRRNRGDQMMDLLKGGEAAWIRKGFDLLMMKKPGEALDIFARGLEKDPKDPTGWLGRGIALSRLGDDRKALEFFDYALGLSPGMARVWFGKGLSLARLSRHEQALSCFGKVLSLDPTDARAWFRKGLSCEALGRHRDAFDCYDQAVRFSDSREIRERRDAVLGLIRQGTC